jgi:hypothetical protein
MRGEITLAKLDCISGLNDASAFAGAFFLCKHFEPKSVIVHKFDVKKNFYTWLYTIGRVKGAILVLIFVVYLVFLFLQEHL